MEPLRDYRVINHRLLSSLGRQAGLSNDDDVTVENALNLTIKGFGGSRTVTRKQASGGDELQILKGVVDKLRSSGQLRIYRPGDRNEFRNAHDSGGWYVFEDMLATPVFVPLADKFKEKFQARSVSVPDALTVWVSDPLDPVEFSNPPDLENHYFTFGRGAFVFLIEELGNFKGPGGNISGLSALRLVVDFLSTGGRDYERDWHIVRDYPDEFCLANFSHPIEKLATVGGYAGRPRQIESVYKIAYVSDEQAAVVNGHRLRVYDILAYPLYIAE